jgi:putative ABC transport system permease protein
VLSLWLRLALIKPLLLAVTRMSVQLVLIGIFLKYLFAWNNIFANIAWLVVMISVAVFSAIRSSELTMRKVFLPTFLSFTFATFIVVLYMNFCVLRLDYVFDVRYLVVLGGMLLGNALRGNIIGIGNFYGSIRNDYKHYQYLLSLGANRFEALLPYLRESVLFALKPSLAAMATIGIVSLPGMMTGVILGGAEPQVAIKYQIMIMLAIIVSTSISVTLTIITTARTGITGYGTLAQDIFVTKRNENG